MHDSIWMSFQTGAPCSNFISMEEKNMRTLCFGKQVVELMTAVSICSAGIVGGGYSQSSTSR